MRNIIGIFFLLALSNVGFSQIDSLARRRGINRIEIDYGFVHTRLIDEGFTQNKFLFRGTNSKVGFRYERRSNVSIFGFATSFADGTIRMGQKEWPASYLNLTLAAEYLKRINQIRIADKECLLFTGFRFSTVNHLIQNEPIFDNIDIVSLHGVHLKMQFEVTLDKRQAVIFAYAMPTVVYTNQVLWNSGASKFDFDDLENVGRLLTAHGKFSYFSIFRNIPIEVVYRRKLGGVVDFNVRYGFSYVKSDVDEPLRIYSNEVLFCIVFKF